METAIFSRAKIIVMAFSWLFPFSNSALPQSLPWERIGAPLDNKNFSSVLVDSKGHILCSTVGYMLIGGTNLGDSVRFYLSDDQGTHWSQIPAPPGQATELVTTNSRHQVFASCYRGSAEIELTFRGKKGKQKVTINALFRSDDDGVHWSEIGKGLSSFRSIVIDRNDNLYAGTEYSGVFMSTDNGTSWRPLNKVVLERINSLGVDPSGAIFASKFDTTGRTDLFRSTNRGKTWERVSTGITETNRYGEKFFPGMGAFACNNGGSIYAACGDCIYRSTDNGTNWLKLFTKPSQGIGSVISSLAVSSPYIYAGISMAGFMGGHNNKFGGAWRSTDNGVTWEYAGLMASEIQQWAVDSSGNIYAAAIGGGENPIRAKTCGLFKLAAGDHKSTLEKPPAAEVPKKAQNVSGTWTGSGSDNSGPGTLVFILNQSDNNVSGTCTMIDPQSGFGMAGTITGKTSNDSLVFQLVAKYQKCDLKAEFSAKISGSTMSGTYAGTNSCSGPVTDGKFTVTKQ